MSRTVLTVPSSGRVVKRRQDTVLVILTDQMSTKSQPTKECKRHFIHFIVVWASIYEQPHGPKLNTAFCTNMLLSFIHTVARYACMCVCLCVWECACMCRWSIQYRPRRLLITWNSLLQYVLNTINMWINNNIHVLFRYSLDLYVYLYKEFKSDYIYDIKYMCCYFCTFLATGHLNVQCLCLVMLFILNGHLPWHKYKFTVRL